MPFAATWMRPESITLSEVKSERERQIPYDIIYMGNLKYDTNKPIYKNRNRITDIENRLERGGGKGRRGGEEGGRGELGVQDQQMQTGIYRMGKQQILLYSPENCIQQPVTNQNKKEYEKERI